ncbi:MAG: TonB family protein [Candidatus Omnitrophota bacterium]
MIEQNKTFQAALLISMCLHATLFLPRAFCSKYFFPKAKIADIEVTYLISSQDKLSLPAEKTALPSEPIYLPKKEKSTAITTKKHTVSVYKRSVPGTKKVNIRDETNEFYKRQAQSLKESKIYLDYYSNIREKIRRNVIYPAQFKRGDIFLTFTITKKGQLHCVQIIEENSASDQFLQKAAIRSIEAATPFPAIPEKIDREELTFNLVISFEVESPQT